MWGIFTPCTRAFRVIIEKTCSDNNLNCTLLLYYYICIIVIEIKLVNYPFCDLQQNVEVPTPKPVEVGNQQPPTNQVHLKKVKSR